MKRSLLVPCALLVACGGNVVVDPTATGTPATGGQTTTSSSTGMGGAILMTSGTGATSGTTTATSGTGAASSCVPTGCSTDSQSCACTGTCNGGEAVSVTCPSGGGPCTCSLMKPGESQVVSCTPMPGQLPTPCDIITGCCAQFW